MNEYQQYHSFIPLACAECDDSLPFAGASSIPLCWIPFPSTFFHQLVCHPSSLHLAIYFLVYLVACKFTYNTFWDFYFLPFSVHVQTNVIYLTLSSLLPTIPCIKKNTTLANWQEVYSVTHKCISHIHHAPFTNNFNIKRYDPVARIWSWTIFDGISQMRAF